MDMFIWSLSTSRVFGEGLVCNLDGLGINKDNKSKHLGNGYSLVTGTAPIASHVLTHLILKLCARHCAKLFRIFFFSIYLFGSAES